MENSNNGQGEFSAPEEGLTPVPKKPRRHRPDSYKRLRIDKDNQRPGRVVITIDLDPSVAEQLCKFQKTDLVKQGLIKALRQVVGAKVVPKRKRSTYPTPQVPTDLRNDFMKRLKMACAKDKRLPCTATAYLKDLLSRVIDFKKGKRVTKRKGGNSIKMLPRDSKELVLRGKVLMRDNQGNLSRFSFDAGKAYDALTELISALTLSHSEFFSALIERASNLLPAVTATSYGADSAAGSTPITPS